MSYLTIENMEIAFNTVKGKFVAVKDIDLEVKKGKSYPSLAIRAVESRP